MCQLLGWFYCANLKYPFSLCLSILWSSLFYFPWFWAQKWCFHFMDSYKTIQIMDSCWIQFISLCEYSTPCSIVSYLKIGTIPYTSVSPTLVVPKVDTPSKFPREEQVFGTTLRPHLWYSLGFKFQPHFFISHSCPCAHWEVTAKTTSAWVPVFHVGNSDWIPCSYICPPPHPELENLNLSFSPSPHPLPVYVSLYLSNKSLLLKKLPRELWQDAAYDLETR